MKNLILPFFCFSLAFNLAAKIDYTGHKVIRVIPDTPEQLKFLHNLQAENTVDFLTLPMRKNNFADIRVSSESYFRIARSLSDMNMNHEIYIADLGKLEQQEQESISRRRALYSGKTLDLENYHTYEEVIAYLTDLSSTNPLVSTKVGGTTYQGRDIVQAIISSNLTAKKPVVFFDCNIHAREWVTTATCIWIIDQLTSRYGSDPEITLLIDQYDWKFLPLPNPDGYVYSWETDRTWRKNRVVNNGSDCLGVDPNRNFPVGFGESGASNLTCSEAYHGEEAFTERESIAIRDLIAADRGRVKTAISVHAFSQLLMSPYGYSLELTPEYPEMLRVMEAAVNALTATYGTPYGYGNAADTLFISSGVTIDHYYVNEGIIHSYWIELRDTGFYGYQLPADQIVPTATETWNGIKALVNAI